MYGVVILVQNLLEDCLRALKIIYKSRLNEEECGVIKTESEILEKLKQQSNIVQFHQVSAYCLRYYRCTKESLIYSLRWNI